MIRRALPYALAFALAGCVAPAQQPDPYALDAWRRELLREVREVSQQATAEVLTNYERAKAQQRRQISPPGEGAESE